MPADPPLPTREETERQIRAEAAAIQRETDQRLEQQEEDLRSLRDDERQRFLDELKMILKVHRQMAGPEIERLTDRTGRTGDPMVLARARAIIYEQRLSQRSKVRRLRELRVPETVILDYLANDLDRLIGARDGPRNRNEVWIRAAHLLLIYESPPPRPAPPPPAGGAPRPR